MNYKLLGVLLAIGVTVISPVSVYAGTTKPVPVVSNFKTYMDYRAITNKSSQQWQLQKLAYTDSNGLRKVDDRFLIAVGSYFTRNIGQKVDVQLGDGTVLPCIVGDAKADGDTINGHSTGRHNDAIEFIVDQRGLHSVARERGDISYISGFSGNVTSLTMKDTQTEQEEVVADTLELLEEAPEVQESMEVLAKAEQERDEAQQRAEEAQQVYEDTIAAQEVVTVAVSTEKPIVMNVLENLSDVQI